MFLLVAWLATWHWLVHIGGVDYNLPYGHWSWYNFQSGAGANFQELAIVGLIAGAYKKHQCHDQRCWRPGWYPAKEGGGWHYCRKHHTDHGIHK